MKKLILAICLIAVHGVYADDDECRSHALSAAICRDSAAHHNYIGCPAAAECYAASESDAAASRCFTDAAAEHLKAAKECRAKKSSTQEELAERAATAVTNCLLQMEEIDEETWTKRYGDVCTAEDMDPESTSEPSEKCLNAIMTNYFECVFSARPGAKP